MAQLLARINDPAAEEFAALAVELQRNDPRALRFVLSLFKRPQDVFFRLHWLRRLLELEPDNESVYAELIGIYLGFGVRLQEAARLAKHVHKTRPTAGTYLWSARVALADGRHTDGLAFLRRGLRAHPADTQLEEALRLAAEHGPPEPEGPTEPREPKTPQD